MYCEQTDEKKVKEQSLKYNGQEQHNDYIDDFDKIIDGYNK